MRIFKVTGFPVPKHAACITLGTWIFMKHEHVNDENLAHEVVHVRQFLKQPFTFWLRYILSPKARLNYEAEAYIEQLNYAVNHGNNDVKAIIGQFTHYLASHYYLKFTKEEIKQCLMLWYDKLNHQDN